MNTQAAKALAIPIPDRTPAQHRAVMHAIAVDGRDELGACNWALRRGDGVPRDATDVYRLVRERARRAKEAAETLERYAAGVLALEAEDAITEGFDA